MNAATLNRFQHSGGGSTQDGGECYKIKINENKFDIHVLV